MALFDENRGITYSFYLNVFFSRLIAVGEEFCSSTSEDLHESIRRQTVKYFKTYHRSRMDELRMFLENEVWELCPVKASFKIVDLSVSIFRNYLICCQTRGERLLKCFQLYLFTAHFYIKLRMGREVSNLKAKLRTNF